MPTPTAQNLIFRLRSAARLTFERSTVSTAASSRKKLSSSSATVIKNKPSSSTPKKPASSSPEDDALKNYVSSITSSSSSQSVKFNFKNFKAPPSPIAPTPPTSSLCDIVDDSLDVGCESDNDESAKQLAKDASTVLYDEMKLDWDDECKDNQSVGTTLSLPWFSSLSNSNVSIRRKEVSRHRKQKWIFKNSQTSRFDRLVKMCARKFGADTTIGVFGKLGKETGLKEYNALIKSCIENARTTTDEDVSLEQIYKAYQILKLMTEHGFTIEEETYGQFLIYLIDYGMVKEFFFFHELIKEENPHSLPRLAYYEMLLWIRLNDDEKVQELCRTALAADETEGKHCFRECLLLASCEGDRREEFLMLLKTLDITKFTSPAFLESIFQSLGKFILEPLAENLLLELKRNDSGAESISNFICEYAINLPNLPVEDIIEKFQKLHQKLEVLPTSGQYEKLIRYCCELFKVHEALDIVDKVLESGGALSLETFHAILDACNQSFEFNLVHQINSRISSFPTLKPNNETYRKMILLYVKMKDFEGAYGLLTDLLKMGMKPTVCMYNTILAGYYHEKKFQNALNVLKQMEDVDVTPNAQTYCHLIGNCHRGENIIKFYDEMINSGIKPTKHVFMAMINAYASCGLFEKAKQVLLDRRIPFKDLNRIKGVLISALASNGEFSSALKMYEESKESKCDLEPKAIRCLIEHFHAEGESSKLFELLEEIKNSRYWTDACFEVISHCVQEENLRSTVDLLKKLKDKFSSEISLDVLFDEVFCLYAEKGAKDMQFGLNLLQAIKEELGCCLSRKSLDFLLMACVNAKDSKSCFTIWKEYQMAGLPYNVLSYLRMYQALLASGDEKSAAQILTKISRDDPHVWCVIEACRKTYTDAELVQPKQKKKKKRALVAMLGLLDGLEPKTQ